MLYMWQNIYYYKTQYDGPYVRFFLKQNFTVLITDKI